MSIKKVYLGTWFQRTDLHLREIYNFFVNGLVSEQLNQQKIKELRDTFGKVSVDFCEDIINYCLLKTPNGIVTEFTEDGIITLSKNYKDANGDIKLLQNFYENTLSPAINYLFSRGAPLPKELADIKLVFPFFFVATGITDNDAKELLIKLDDGLITAVEGTKLTLYVGSVGNILAFKHQEGLKLANDFIKYGVFFREFESQLAHYLKLHRQIWEEMDAIRAQKSIKRGDFAKIRNQLMARKKFLSFVSARLAQMDHLIAEREKYVEDQKLRDELKQISWDSFASVVAAYQYIIDLWKMTDEYVESTIRLLEIFYQENTQRELFALELISLFNVVIGLVNFFKTVNVLDLLVVVISGVIFFVTLKYLIRGQSFTLPQNQ